MKKIILSLALTVIALPGNETKAQVGAYSFSQTSGTYGATNSGTLIGTTTQDDDVNSVLLPFGFTFNGITYTTANICSNGYLSFNTLTGTEYDAISDLMTTQVIAPFAQDLLMGKIISGDLTSGSNTITNVSSLVGINVGDSLTEFSFGFGGISPTVTAISGNSIVVNLNSLNSVSGQDIYIKNGSIRQSVIGASPNRVCEFEFRNMMRFSVYDEIINFKLRLYETTNRIEVVFGFINPGLAGIGSEVGLKGTSNLDFNSRRVNFTNTWNTSIAATQIAHNCSFSTSSFPSSGLTYQWDPVSCSNPVITISQSNSTICSGQTATLTANGATTYSWSNGATTASIVVSPTNTATYILLGYNGACNASVNVTQQVTQNPTLSVIQTNSVICGGTTATLTANGATTYSWSNGATTASIVVSPTNTTTYMLLGYNGACNASLNVTQQVIQNPTLSIIQTNSVICGGTTATLTANGATTYSWSNGATTASILVSPANTTTYTVVGYNGACNASLNVTQQVTQNPTLSVIQTNSVICSGSTSTLTANGALTYTWSNGTTASLVAVSPTITTTYTLLGANGLCVAQKTVTQLVDACTGIKESNMIIQNLKVFPNPFKDELSIVNLFEEQAELKLVDLLGNTVYQGLLEVGAKAVVSTGSLSTGIYFVILKQGERQLTRKVLKN